MDKIVKVTKNKYNYYVNRELIKEYDLVKEIKEALFHLNNTPNINVKAQAVLRMAEMDYLIVREKIESTSNPKKLLKQIRGRKYYAGYTLDLDHYTEHWLESHRKAPFMTQQIIMYITDHWYQPKRSKYLKDCNFLYDLDYDC
jgi:hypothetical protein